MGEGKTERDGAGVWLGERCEGLGLSEMGLRVELGCWGSVWGRVRLGVRGLGGKWSRISWGGFGEGHAWEFRERGKPAVLGRGKVGLEECKEERI